MGFQVKNGAFKKGYSFAGDYRIEKNLFGGYTVFYQSKRIGIANTQAAAKGVAVKHSEKK